MILRKGTPEEAGFSPERMAGVKDLAAGWVDEGITPSLVVLAARRGVIALHEAFGKLTPAEDSPPLETDSLFPMTSITKTITATAAMCLVEDGLLGLNRPVTSYIPEFSGEGKDAVLVHHLLTHTSGLRQEEIDAHVARVSHDVVIPPPDATQHPAVQEWLYERYGAPLWRPPGEEMSYSDLNYDLLGEIVRRVSGASLSDFTTDRIFRPLGMSDTYFVLPESLKHRAVRRPVGARFSAREEVEMDIPFPAAGLSSTALDMAVFGQMFLNRGRYGDARILSPPTVAAMTRNQIPGISVEYFGEFHDEAYWGYGWDVHGPGKWSNYPAALLPPEAFRHSGLGGVHYWIDPVHGIVGVYFSVNPDPDRPTPTEHFVDAVTAAVDD
jgi:CubicO group peptidase (beta-lactamase class C family)